MQSSQTRLTLLETALRAGVDIIIIVAFVVLSLIILARWHAVEAMGDVTVYFNFASCVFSGRFPYSDCQLEYPPVAALLFLVPRTVGQTPFEYLVAFASLMLLFHFLQAALVLHFLASRYGKVLALHRFMWFTAGSILLAPLIVSRFDSMPALLGFSATYLMCKLSPRLAGCVAGFGVLTKVFPGLTTAPAAIAELRCKTWRRSRFGQALLFTSIAGVVVWLIIGRSGVNTSVGYHANRGVEIESLYSGLILLVSPVLGLVPARESSSGPQELVTTFTKLIAVASVFVQMAAVTIVSFLASRQSAHDPFRAGATSTLTFILFGKVLSPQYMIWLLPLIPCIQSRTRSVACLLFFLSCLLTIAIFPWMWFDLLAFRALPIVLLNLRNLLLFVLLLTLLLGPREIESAE